MGIGNEDRIGKQRLDWNRCKERIGRFGDERRGDKGRLLDFPFTFIHIQQKLSIKIYHISKESTNQFSTTLYQSALLPAYPRFHFYFSSHFFFLTRTVLSFFSSQFFLPHLILSFCQTRLSFQTSSRPFPYVLTSQQTILNLFPSNSNRPSKLEFSLPVIFSISQGMIFK